MSSINGEIKKSGASGLLNKFMDEFKEIGNALKSTKDINHTKTQNTYTAPTPTSSGNKTIVVNEKHKTEYENKITVTTETDTKKAEQDLSKLANTADKAADSIERLKSSLNKLSTMKAGGNLDISTLLKSLESTGTGSGSSKVQTIIKNAIGNEKNDFTNGATFGRLKGTIGNHLKTVKGNLDAEYTEILNYVEAIDKFLNDVEKNIKPSSSKSIDLKATKTDSVKKTSTKNVTVDDIIKTFGLIDVTIKNIVKKANLQQETLNKLYESLSQLSAKTGIDPKEIGNGLIINLTQLKQNKRGSATKNKKLNLNALNWHDNTPIHEYAHALLSGLAQRLYGKEEFEKIGSPEAVNNIFNNAEFKKLKARKGVKQSDIDIAETVRDIVTTALSKDKGGLRAKINANRNKSDNHNYYKRGGEVFARLFATGVTGKVEDSNFELDQKKFNELIAPQLTKLVQQMFGKNAQNRIKLTGSKAQTSIVIDKAKARLRQNQEEKARNEGESHDSLASARRDFASNFKSAVSDSNTFEQNIKNVLGSSVKSFEENFKSAIQHISETFRNEFITPMKELTVSFGNIFTSLRKSGIIVNTNSIKQDVKKVVNTEYDIDESDAIEVPDIYKNKKFARRMVVPGAITSPDVSGVYSKYTGTVSMIKPDPENLGDNNLLLMNDFRFANQIKQARHYQQQAIDMSMFNWIEEGTTQASYTNDLNRQYKELQNLYNMYKRLGSNEGMQTISSALSEFRNESPNGFSLFKGGKIDLTPNISSSQSMGKDGKMKTDYFVEGIDATLAKKIKDKYASIIEEAYSDIEGINNIRFANKNVKRGSDSTNDMILQSLRLHNVMQGLNDQLNKSQYGNTGWQIMNTYSPDDLNALKDIKSFYNMIQGDLQDGKYETDKKSFQTDFALLKTEIDQVVSRIRAGFNVEKEKISARSDNRTNAYNAAVISMESKLDRAARFMSYGSGVDRNTKIFSDYSTSDYYNQINDKINEFKNINPKDYKDKDELYEDIRETQFSINKIFTDMKDAVKQYKKRVKQAEKDSKDAYKEDVTSYKREQTLTGLLQDARNLDAISKIEDTTKTNFYNYYKSLNAQDKRVAFDTEYARISQKLSTGGYATDLEFTKDINGLKSILEELKVVAKIWSERENAELKAEEQFNKNIDNLLKTAETRVDKEQKELQKTAGQELIAGIKSEQNLDNYIATNQTDKFKQIDSLMLDTQQWYQTNKNYVSQSGYSDIVDMYQNLSYKLSSEEAFLNPDAITMDIKAFSEAIRKFKDEVNITTKSIENQQNWERNQFNKENASDGQKLIEGVKSEQNLFAYQKKEDESLKSSQDRLYKYIDDQIISLNRWYFSDETNQMFGSAGYSNIMDEYQNLSSRIGSDEFKTDRTAIEHAINDLKVSIDEFKKSVTSDKTIATNSIENQFKWEREQNNINSNLEQIRNNAVAKLTADMNGFVQSLGTNVILRSGALTERGDVVYGAGGLTARYNPLNGQGVSSDLSGIITDVGNIDLTQGAQHLNNEIQRLTIAFKALIDQTNQNINNEIKRDSFNTQQNNQRTQQIERDLRQQNTDFSRIDKLNTMAMDFDAYLGTNTISGGNIVNYGQIADRLGLNIQEIQDMITYIQTGVAGDRFTGLQGSVDYNEYMLILKNTITEFESAISAALRDEQVNKHDEQKQIRANKTLRDIDSFYNTFSHSLSNDTGVLRDGNTQTRADIYNWINPMGTGYISALRQNLIDRFNNGEFDNNPIALADAIQEFKDELAMANKQINNAIAGIKQENQQAKNITLQGQIDKQLHQETLRGQLQEQNLEKIFNDFNNWYFENEKIGNQHYRRDQIYNNAVGYVDIYDAYNSLQDRISSGEFQNDSQAFTLAINEFKTAVNNFTNGAKTAIDDFKLQRENELRLQRESAQILSRATTSANRTEAQINRGLRNPTLNTLFADSGDPYLRGNVRLRLTQDENNEFRRLLEDNERRLREMRRVNPNESAQDRRDRLARNENWINQNEQERLALRDRIADRIGRQVGRTYNEYQEIYNPLMQQFMHSTGFNIFRNPNERGVDWEVLSGGFTEGNRERFTAEIMKFINLPTFKQGISKMFTAFQGMFKGLYGMLSSAFGKIMTLGKTALTSLGVAIGGVTASVTAAITAFGVLGKSVINTTDEFRRNTLALTGVYRTPSRAHEMIQMAYKTSANMPMDYSAAMTTLNEISAIPAVQKVLRSPNREISQSMMDKMFKVITAMTTMRPDKTASDAVFSLRNAFAGDLRSLQRRFDLPVSAIPNVKNGIGLGAVKNDPMAMLDSLNQYFDSFLDMNVLNQVSKTIGVMTEKIKGAFDLFKANIGNSGIYDLVLDDVEKIKDAFIGFVDSDYGKEIAKRLSDALGNSYEAIKGIGEKIGLEILGAFGFDTSNIDIANIITTMSESFAKALRLVQHWIEQIDIKGYLQKAFDYISNIDIKDGLDKIISGLDVVYHKCKTIFEGIVEGFNTLNNARKALGIDDKSLATGAFFVWLFGAGNIQQSISSMMNMIVGTVMTGLGVLNSYITIQSSVFIAQGTSVVAGFRTMFNSLYQSIVTSLAALRQHILNGIAIILTVIRRAVLSTIGFIRHTLLPLTAIAAEVYLIGNNFEVIGETAANVIDSITAGFSKAFATISNWFSKTIVWFSKEFESSFSFLEYIAEELDAIVDIVAGGAESLFDENGIQAYVNAFKLAFDKIMTAITHEVTYYLGKAVFDGVMLPLFSGLSKIGVMSKKLYESHVSDSKKESTRVRKIADDAWSGLGDKIINALPNRLSTKIKYNRERTSNAWNKWQNDRKKTDKQLYAERQVLYDKIDVDLENTYKEIDERLAKKMEDNKKLYNPEGKDFSLGYNGKLFGEKVEFLDWLFGYGDYAGLNSNETNSQQSRNDIVTQNKNILSITDVISNVYDWLKQKAEPVLNVVESLYKTYSSKKVETDYVKLVNKESEITLKTAIRTQQSQYMNGFDFGTNSIFNPKNINDEQIYFGAERIEKLKKDLLNSMGNTEEYIAEFNNLVDAGDTFSSSKVADMQKAINENKEAVKQYIEEINYVIAKSTEIIDDAIANTDFSFVSKDVNKYIAAQSRSFTKKISSEVFNSIMQDYSSYFATSDMATNIIMKNLEIRHGNVGKLIEDYKSGNMNLADYSRNDVGVVKAFIERLDSYITLMQPIINEQSRRKVLQSNIGNMRLGKLTANWNTYMNDSSAVVRESAGKRYKELINEGIEGEGLVQIARHIRDVAIDSFTDMKTATINAVESMVKSTQQTVKNGLDKMIASGGTFKESFKEIGKNIKKEFWGVYTTQVGNTFTEYLFGSVKAGQNQTPEAKMQQDIENTYTLVGEFKVTQEDLMRELIYSVNTLKPENNIKQSVNNGTNRNLGEIAIKKQQEWRTDQSRYNALIDANQTNTEEFTNIQKKWNLESRKYTSQYGRCAMAVNRDLWEYDKSLKKYATGDASHVRAGLERYVKDHPDKMKMTKLTNPDDIMKYYNNGGKNYVMSYGPSKKHSVGHIEITLAGSQGISDFIKQNPSNYIEKVKSGEYSDVVVFELLDNINSGVKTMTADITEISDELNNKYGNPLLNKATRKVTDIGADRNKYDNYIKEASKTFDVPEHIIKGIINTESTFENLSANSVGAIGLMQVRNVALEDVKKYKKFKNIDTNYDLTNPRDNIMAGTAYFRWLQDHYFNGNIPLNLTAYNTGAGAVKQGISNGNNYASTVLMFANEFAKEIGGKITGSANITPVMACSLESLENNGISRNDNSRQNTFIQYLKGIYQFVDAIADAVVNLDFTKLGNLVNNISAPTITNILTGTNASSNSTVDSILKPVFNKNTGLFDSIELTNGGSNILNNAVNMAGAGMGGIGGMINFAGFMNTAGSNLKVKNTEEPVYLTGDLGKAGITEGMINNLFGNSTAGTYAINFLNKKGLLDSFAQDNMFGTTQLDTLKGANYYTKIATGVTNTLFGKSVGQKLATSLTKSRTILGGASIGSALPVIGTVATILSKKGWAGGPKDRTAEGKARGAEFTSLRTSLIANRNAMARNYYMANDDTLEALQNYEFGGIRQWDEKRGKWYKGTRRRITRTDATEFTNSMTGYWDLIQKADEEQRATQRKLNTLQNTNNMEYLRQTGMYEEKRKTSIQSDLEKYKAAVTKYAGLDTGFKQTLFDGKEYTLTELNDKVNELIKELGDSSDAIAQNTEAIRQEKLATESSRLDYITALYSDINPTIAQINNKQKLENEWKSIENDDGTIGYKEGTKEYWDYMTRVVQADRELKNAQKQKGIDLSTNWISDLRGIAMDNGTYNLSQIKKLSKLYGQRESLNSQIENAVSNMDSALAERLYDESQAITEEIEHYKSSTSFSNAINDAKESMNNIFNNVNEKVITNLTDNVKSMLSVIEQSEQWIKDAGYSGYDELDSSVLLPLFNSAFGNVNDMSNVFTEGLKSGVFDTTQINPFKEYSNSMFDTLDSFKTEYRDMVDSGATKKELQKLVKSYQDTILANVTGMNSEYEKMFKAYQQDVTAGSILNSISGFEDYTVANDALKEFTETLGSDAMEKLIGYGGEFGSESLGKFMNVSGLNKDSDPYEMYHEWEKKHIMQRIENSEEGSEEWYAAELELWNLMADNAKYLKEKAEKTTATIEEMLNKIEETARTRVAEEAKSTKGDVIFFDLGSSREGNQYITKMLNAIKTNDKDAQKLVSEMKQKLLGIR